MKLCVIHSTRLPAGIVVYLTTSAELHTLNAGLYARTNVNIEPRRTRNGAVMEHSAVSFHFVQLRYSAGCVSVK